MTDTLRRLAKNTHARWMQWRWHLRYANKPSDLAALELPHAGLIPLIWVNADKLVFKCKLDTKRVYRGRLFVPGNWDEPRITVDRQEQKDPRYQGCKELLSGMPVRECSEFKALLARLQAGQQPRGLNTEAQIEKYLYQQLAMYKQVQAQGALKTQAELGKARYGGEINCVVGHDGELLKTTDGNHRLAVARVLGIKRVPVQVSRIHTNLLPYVQGLSQTSATQAVNKFLLELQARYS